MRALTMGSKRPTIDAGDEVSHHRDWHNRRVGSTLARELLSSLQFQLSSDVTGATACRSNSQKARASKDLAQDSRSERRGEYGRTADVRKDRKQLVDTPSHKPEAPLLVECPMCHQRVPETQMTLLAGRPLCFACAGAWFDDEPED